MVTLSGLFIVLLVLQLLALGMTTDHLPLSHTTPSILFYYTNPVYVIYIIYSDHFYSYPDITLLSPFYFNSQNLTGQQIYIKKKDLLVGLGLLETNSALSIFIAERFRVDKNTF